MSLPPRRSRFAVALFLFGSATVSHAPATAAPATVTEQSIWNSRVDLPGQWGATKAVGGSNTVTAQSVSTRTVIGDDDRVQTPAPQAFPYRTAVFIMATDPNGRKRGCTGFMYGPRSVATSAHCLLSADGWNTDYHVIPAVSGGMPPYGECGWIKASIDPDFAADRTPEHDLGALQLDCTVGTITGWLGPGPDEASVGGDVVESTGYPLDKALWEMWTARGSITAVSDAVLTYDIDTTGGQSGSAVTRTADPSTAVAVHSTGFATENEGTRLTAEQTTALIEWSSSLAAE